MQVSRAYDPVAAKESRSHCLHISQDALAMGKPSSNVARNLLSFVEPYPTLRMLRSVTSTIVPTAMP